MPVIETDVWIPTATTLFGDVQPGDWVIAAGNNDYRYLIGMVTAIYEPGTLEHDTGNETDDVHVDFTAFDYPAERVREIEEHFYSLSGYPKSFDDLALDDVIMAPKMLIRITHLGQDEIAFMGNLRQNCESFCNCFPGGREYHCDKQRELIERLDENLVAYHDSLMGFGKRELIEMAEKIAAMSDAYSYMCYRDFDDGELEFYLQFQNPLEVVADALCERNSDPGDDLGYVMCDLYDKQGALADYPLMRDPKAPADPDLRRYMDIDLELYLGKIAEKVIIHYPSDWDYDKKALHKAAMSDNPEDKRLMWHVCGYGTHLNTERDTFIKDTGAFSCWVDYRQKDEDMFGYVVEVTGYEGGIVKGNVFEVGDYYAHSLYVGKTALVLDSVSLTYSDAWGANAGKTITVPRYEYDGDRHRLMSESGNVKAICYHPSESVREMSELLRHERAKRMALPIGSTGELLRKMADRLAEVRAEPESKEPEKPPTDKKTPIGERIKAGNVKVKAYKEQKAQNPQHTSKNEKEIY